MDQAAVLEIVHRYAEAIREKFEFNRLFLFGSYAKGSFHEDSDIDIAVVFSDFDNALYMQWELMRLRRDLDIRIEPHPFRERDFEVSNPLVHEILQSGLEIKAEKVQH
ncbi:MAG TPA: nucleotidyltransferase domain-containing protein [Leeuwenhoekiella sp.]|nr:nucleotidyltransferase domain-containing protein [Leeuwenhoekiella sp.]